MIWVIRKWLFPFSPWLCSCRCISLHSCSFLLKFLAMSDDPNAIALQLGDDGEPSKAAPPAKPPGPAAGKDRGRGAGKFNSLFGKDKSTPPPKTIQKGGKGNDDSNKKQKTVSQKQLIAEFNSGVILQAPVGLVPIFTTMLVNFGFVASAINEAKSRCSKPETCTIHPFLAAMFDLTAFAVRRAFNVKEESVTPFRARAMQG